MTSTTNMQHFRTEPKPKSDHKSRSLAGRTWRGTLACKDRYSSFILDSVRERERSLSSKCLQWNVSNVLQRHSNVTPRMCEPICAWMVHTLICDFLKTSLKSYDVELCVCWIYCCCVRCDSQQQKHMFICTLVNLSIIEFGLC